MKQYMGTHKVKRGESLLTIAKKYYGDASAGKYIAKANGNIPQARAGQVLKLPNVTAVGEAGVELAFHIGGKQEIIAPHGETRRMLSGGFRPQRGLRIGGAMDDEYEHPVTGTTQTTTSSTSTSTKPPREEEEEEW